MPIWFGNMYPLDGYFLHSWSLVSLITHSGGGYFVDEGGGPTNPEESLPILLEGRIHLATPEKKDRNTASRGGDANYRIPRECLGRP